MSGFLDDLRTQLKDASFRPLPVCFGSIDHTALMDRVRTRVKDKHVSLLVKAFLKTGVMAETGHFEDNPTGTPQGGVLSPLLANIVLSALDEHVHGPWRTGGAMGSPVSRALRRRRGLPNWWIVRYADDFVVLVFGSCDDTKALREEIAGVLAPLGQDSCPDTQVVATATQGRAETAQPDHARLVQLLQIRSRQEHHANPRYFRLAAGCPVADATAPLELDRSSKAPHRPHRPLEDAFIRRGRTVQPRPGANRAIPVPRQQDPKSLESGQPRLTAETVESPVRGNTHAGFGERPAETDRWRHRHRAAGRLNHPGAQLRITDADGMRITCFTPNTPDRPIAELELRHRLRARAEDRIRAARSTGLRSLPLHDTAQNQVWLEIVQLALDPLAWMPVFALTGQARLWEPRRLRFRLFSAAAQPVTTGRRRILRLARHWPWTVEITTAVERLMLLPNPG
jgi:hypothetical protein